MINISEINKAKSLSSSKTKKSADGSSFSAYLKNSVGEGSKAVSGASGITVTDAIFAAQMVNDEEQKQMRRKMLKRGQTLIEKLEEIRDGLLLGHISKDRLIEISRYVKDRSFQADDDKLNGIISEIELRVEVELAKLTRTI